MHTERVGGVANVTLLVLVTVRQAPLQPQLAVLPYLAGDAPATTPPRPPCVYSMCAVLLVCRDV